MFWEKICRRLIDRPYSLPVFSDFPPAGRSLKVMEIEVAPLKILFFGSTEKPLDVPLLHIIFIPHRGTTQSQSSLQPRRRYPATTPARQLRPFENQDLGWFYGLKLSWDNMYNSMGSRRAPEAPTSLLLAPARKTPAFFPRSIAFWKAFTTH